MRYTIKKIITLIFAISCVYSTFAYAEIPDSSQSSMINNLAYDVISKFYFGANTNYSVLTEDKVKVSGNTAKITNNQLGFGIFSGYKFNDYVALEVNFQRFAQIRDDDGGSNSLALTYDATIYNLSADLLLNYPVFIKYFYTISVFAKGGYGLNFTDYKYNAGNGLDVDSGNFNNGAYNFGLGVNIDLRSNISLRLGYTYYQTYYPLPGDSNNHGSHVFSFDLYYNIN
jgi:opacity protein-like surface antigen